MPIAKVNDSEVEFENGMTVLQVCELAGEEIPRFCYHERLEIAGNCRMCLVEIKGGPPKPAASCAMPAGDGMEIYTNSPMVKKAREGVMEFLLINHPLDCPICDQAGECDLQDQAMAYGGGDSRYAENKRGVKDKYIGPLIKTEMTRCIHCTRCIRFMDDVAGVHEMGATGRGEDMEVGTFVEANITSELSGNLVDLCPVGALTSRPYAFKARSWELNKTESIDVLDAVGCNIRVDARGQEVMRVMPRLNEDINEEWISDKARFACDGLKAQRLDRPYIRKDGRLQEATWNEALAEVGSRLKNTDPKKIGAIAGAMVDAESILLLKRLFDGLRSPNIDCRQDGMVLDGKNRSAHLFNTTIAGIEEADAVLIIGANPRYEAPLINTRIRKLADKRVPVALIGEQVDLTYKYEHLGNSADILSDFASAKNSFAKIMKKAERPVIILGVSALNRSDSEAVLGIVSKICYKLGVISDNWNGYNVLHTEAARVAGLELGFVPGKGGKDVSQMVKLAAGGKDLEVLYLLGADELPFKSLKKTFTIYQGHHGDEGAENADVILPGSAYTEKNATYLNMEGRMQRTARAIFPPGKARDDWKIISSVFEHVGLENPFMDEFAIRDALAKASPLFKNLDQLPNEKFITVGKESKLNKGGFGVAVENFYMTDVISRASKTMASCVNELVNSKKKKAA